MTPEVEALIQRTMAAHECDELTATTLALQERLAVNVGLVMENAELRRKVRGES